MDLNDMRVVLTVLGFVGFLAIVVWAYSKGAKKGFTEASELPFADEKDANCSPDKGKTE